MAEEKTLTKEEEMLKYSTVPLDQLSEEEYKALEEYVNLPEEEKRSKKKVDTKFVRCKLPVDQIEQLEQLYPEKRCVGVRKAVDEYLYKYARPEDDQLARAWEALKSEFPETQGFQYFEGCKVMAKRLGIEEEEAYLLFDKLCREGYAKRIKTGDYVVWSSRAGTETQIQEMMRMNAMLYEIKEVLGDLPRRRDKDAEYVEEE